MNDTLQRALGDIPWRVWAFLLIQGVLIILWGARLDWRVGIEEKLNIELRMDLRALEVEHRLIQNKLALIEERQSRVVETNQNQQRQIDYIIQWFAPHATPPGPLPPTLPQRPNQKQ